MKRKNKSGAGRPPLYPLGGLEVGDEFSIPCNHPGTQMVTNSRNVKIARAAYTHAAAHDRKYQVKKQPCGGFTVRRTQ